MFLFPVAYIFSFLYAIHLLLKKEIKGVIIFIIVGLPVYINALTVSYMYGLGKALPYLQALKEICVFAGFIMVLLDLKKKITLHLVDKLTLTFFLCTLIYLILPIGSYDFTSRLIAFKALSMFPVVYFTGRFCKASSINIKHIFSFVCVVSIVAGIVVLIEAITYQHIHTRTGYTDYMINVIHGEASGHYGLIWTFETETGMKRFGSIFSSPLELAAASILALAVVLAIATKDKYKIDFSNFYVFSFLATFLMVVFALSRASFANYFIVIYFFGVITRNKKLVWYFQFFFTLAVIYIAFFLQGDILEFIINTITFENASSMGHVVESLNGITAMAAHPLGLGLGSSGRISMETNDHIGGENQLVIIGVQVGVLMLAVYIWTYVLMIRTGLKELKTATGKKRKLILCVVLIKIGLIIPVITSYIDTFIYITYTTYFLSGLMINMIMEDRLKNKALLATPQVQHSGNLANG